MSNPRRSGYILFCHYKRVKILDATVENKWLSPADERFITFHMLTVPPGLEGIPQDKIRTFPHEVLNELRLVNIQSTVMGEILATGKVVPRRIRGMECAELEKVMRHLWARADDFTRHAFSDLAGTPRKSEARASKLAKQAMMKLHNRMAASKATSLTAEDPIVSPVSSNQAIAGQNGNNKSSDSPDIKAGFVKRSRIPPDDLVSSTMKHEHKHVATVLGNGSSDKDSWSTQDFRTINTRLRRLQM